MITKSLLLITGLLGGIFQAVEKFDLESILRDPSIIKTETGRNQLIATGFRSVDSKKFEIGIKNNQLHGNWASYYENNLLCDSGRIEKNLPDGLWKTWYPNGQVRNIRTYSAEKYAYAKTDLRRGHPKFQHYVITRYANEGKDVSRYFQPKFEKSSIAPDANLLQKIDYNTDAENHGGYAAPYVNSLHHGLFINYYENGAVKDSGNYQSGLRHGLWKEAVNNTMYGMGVYHHGNRYHQWRYYDKSGTLVYTEYYRNNGTIRDRHYFKK
jgi:antitoxin component YwqK of YwqJK toxin-antitoxin module